MIGSYLSADNATSSCALASACFARSAVPASTVALETSICPEKTRRVTSYYYLQAAAMMDTASLTDFEYKLATGH
jgi:hypothetical protein